MQVAMSAHCDATGVMTSSSEEWSPWLFHLETEGENTTVSLSQDKNATEEQRMHAQQTWDGMLESMKKLLERE